MKIVNLVRYILKVYPHSKELSKARLNKIIYLIDWKFTLEHEKQLTQIDWKFNHYGPYVNIIEETILSDDRFNIKSTTNIYGNEKNIIEIIQDKDFSEPTEKEQEIIDFVIEKTRKFYWDKFINLVYSTYPIISQEKGSQLNLVELAKEYKQIKKSEENS
ncbi:Panacea domain-containing protein [Aliarcobacter cryaerophilus]|uniref:Panacea domain-containing protein n=1 Tax=Aliarcobacter cryaerophilus TaxID=28198 RepID=UPI003170D744